MTIGLKRAYDPPAKSDGRRILVDRVWPRGIAKDDLQIDAWLKDLAPSTELRKWFGHDPKKWNEFRQRYARELEQSSDAFEQLIEKARAGRVTYRAQQRRRAQGAARAAARTLGTEEAKMRNWEEVKRWRRERRAQLIARRQAMSQAERRRLQPRIISLLEAHFRELAHARIGFYWPIRGEIGLHPLARRLVQDGAGAALPVVVEKRRPLEFWAWRPGDRLERGVWDIPVPAAREVVQPSALLVPLVGFGGQRYRLGYGGGYYDRTLAVMDPRPLTIGVGYELGRLETIHPQPHDIPMDAIVSEIGVARATDASSPRQRAAATQPNNNLE